MSFQLLQKGDLIVKFGRLDQSSFKSGSLQPVAELVAENENVGVIMQAFFSYITCLFLARYRDTNNSVTADCICDAKAS